MNKTKKVAVAVIHGIGNLSKNPPTQSDKITYSAQLHKRIRNCFGPGRFDANIAWREVFYSDLMQKNQNDLLQRTAGKTRQKLLRRQVVSNLGDAASYRFSADPNNTLYREVHGRANQVFAELAEDTNESAPLVVLAHSLGGHVISNLIWDCQHGYVPPTDKPLCQLKTLAGFLTFGCNIPLFGLGFDFEHRKAIRAADEELPPQHRMRPWWHNYYDRDDVLAYPLRESGKGYEDLFIAGELRDHPINAGNVLQSWNPGSHNGYWKDPDFYEPASCYLDKVLAKISP